MPPLRVQYKEEAQEREGGDPPAFSPHHGVEAVLGEASVSGYRGCLCFPCPLRAAGHSCILG